MNDTSKQSRRELPPETQAYIDRLVAEGPLPTPEQRDKLARLLGLRRYRARAAEPADAEGPEQN